jgi:hypothetical protein
MTFDCTKTWELRKYEMFAPRTVLEEYVLGSKVTLDCTVANGGASAALAALEVHEDPTILPLHASNE